MHRTPDARRRTRRLRLPALVAGLVALATVAVVAPPTPAAPTRPAAQARAEGWDDEGVPRRPAAERYVREAYRAILGRQVDEAGLTYWGNLIDGGYGRGTFARNLVFAGEPLRAQFRALVLAAWGTEPTEGDYTDFLATVRRNGATVESWIVTLLRRDEAYEHAGGTDEGFVELLYEVVLDRAGDEAGIDYWLGRLEGGETREQLAHAFVYSNVALRAVVADAYDRILGRTTDVPGRDFWVTQLRRHGRLHMDKQLLGSAEAWGMGCSVLDSARCLLPFPNDQLTIRDDTTPTGRRVNLKPAWVPAPAGSQFDPTEWNRQDGFSPGQAILLSKGAIDLEQSGLPPLTDIGSSLDEDAPIYIVDVATGERWPYWVEVDTHAPAGPEQALVIRPARNFLDGHTYAVGIGPLKDAEGDPVPTPAAFKVFRDDLPTTSRRIEEQRPMSVFSINEVADAGMEVTDLYLAWHFTIASTENIAERITHMRDESLGETAADFTVTKAEHRDDGTTRVEGTFQVPNYMSPALPGGVLLYDTDTWMPKQDGTVGAPFVCTVPDSAKTDPGRAGLYGHGLLGTGGQANSGYVRDLAREHNMVFCGTDWIGMSESDLPTVANILQDLSRFPQLADRTQQGFLNFMILGRLMTLADGFVTHAAFQGAGGAPAIDDGDLVYYGLSQGGIMGGALTAVSPDITRAVLGVPGMNYSTLLERSVDFDPFFTLLAAKYTSPLDRIMMLGVIQMLWDRGEANGYANHMTANPLPGTPTHQVLLQVAFGDHQVSQFAADVQARTYGASTNCPPLDEGRLPGFTQPLWGIPCIETFPHDGSAIVYWDSGTPTPPYTNQPNRAGDDPHSDPRADPDARDQISEFLVPDGPVVDVCGGSWCEADGA